MVTAGGRACGRVRQARAMPVVLGAGTAPPQADFEAAKRAPLEQPEVCAVDTGFSSFARGWDPLRAEDCSVLWEHMVLQQLQPHFPDAPVRHWRDKVGREVDFVPARRRDEVDAIECKWDPRAFDSAAPQVIRNCCAKGRNVLVTPAGDPGCNRRCGDLRVPVCTPLELLP
jgi:hypothetical protein